MLKIHILLFYKHDGFDNCHPFFNDDHGNILQQRLGSFTNSM